MGLPRVLTTLAGVDGVSTPCVTPQHPFVFDPQAYTTPASVTHSMCSVPAATPTTLTPRNASTTFGALNKQKKGNHQHWQHPKQKTTQHIPAHSKEARIVCPRDRLLNYRWLAVVSLCPSRPLKLLPNVYSRPLSPTAAVHPWLPLPHAIATTFSLIPATGCGSAQLCRGCSASSCPVDSDELAARSVFFLNKNNTPSVLHCSPVL